LHYKRKTLWNFEKEKAERKFKDVKKGGFL